MTLQSVCLVNMLSYFSLVLMDLSHILQLQEISIHHPQKIFFLDSPPFWKFQLSFIHFFQLFGLRDPLLTQEFPIPSVGLYGDFLKLHIPHQWAGAQQENFSPMSAKMSWLLCVSKLEKLACTFCFKGMISLWIKNPRFGKTICETLCTCQNIT